MPDGIPAPNLGYECPIKNVTGNANVKIQNKNLFDDEIEYGSISPNGQPLPTQDCIRSKNFIEVKPETNYNLQNNSGYKGFIYLYDEDKNYLNYFTITSSSFNFRTISLTKYIKFRSLGSENNINTKFQLEYGTTATSYVPHAEQNYPFTFAEGQRGMQGTQPKDDGIHQKKKQIVFDGSEDGWYIPNTNKLRYPIRTPLIADMEITIVYSDYSKGIKSNAFIANNSSEDESTMTNLYSIRRASGSKFCYMFFPKDFFTATTAREIIEEWKAYLAEQYANGTPIIVEYPLEQEEIIPYNETQQAQYNNIKANARSYDDITYITSTSDELGFDMNAVAVADANKVIDNQNSEIDTIKSRLDLLEG